MSPELEHQLVERYPKLFDGYAYDVKDVVDWAADIAIQEAFLPIKTPLAKPEDIATDAMVRTSDGWKHEREVR